VATGRRVWLQLAATDLATRVVATLVLTPLVAVVLRFAIRGSGGVLTDQDIAWFLLSPFGLVTLVVVAAGVALAGLVGQAALMVVGAGDVENRRVTWFDAVRHALRRLPSIFEMALRGFLKILVIAAPFLALAGVVYWWLLTDHDINYYLAEKPPEFWTAAALIGVLLAGLAWFAGRRLVAWTLALPRLLFGGASPAGALTAAEQVADGRRLRLLGMLSGWAVATVLVSAAGAALAGLLGRMLIPTGGARLELVATAIGIAAAVGAVINLAVSVLATVALAIIVLHVDRAWGIPWSAPAVVSSAPSVDAAPSALRVPRWAWLVGVAVVALAAVAGGTLILSHLPIADDVDVIAHRGASNRAPENTLAAVEAAIEDGADWVEVDVQETAEGIVVIHHDADFMRAAGDGRKIWDLSFDEVTAIDIGSWMAPEFDAERVFTLTQLLERCKGRIPVNIELKVYGHGQRLEERVIEEVERAQMEDDVVLMSLHRPTVERLNALRPDWTVGQLAAMTVGDLTKVQADFLAVNAKMATASFIRRAHWRGLDVMVWTVDHPVQMSDLITRGVDGLITNRPALAREVLRQRAELTPVERLLVSFAGRFGFVGGIGEASDESDA
jgi:glycerophosphoryl diester phosphodiesterase